MKLKRDIKKKSSILFIMIFLLILLYNICSIIRWKVDYTNTNKINDSINKIIKIKRIEENKNVEFINVPNEKDKKDNYWYYSTFPLTQINLTYLIKENSDTKAFISVSGTYINYPVVQTKDNKFYLNHTFDKSYNEAGWIFVDYRNNLTELDQNTIIYGHGRIDGAMFGVLRNVLKSKWLDNKDNYVIRLSTLKEDTLWQVFSIYKIPVETYYLKNNFTLDYEYQLWLDTMIGRSEYDFKTNINIKDKILTLSTCYDNSNTRVVMHAKLIKRLKRN